MAKDPLEPFRAEFERLRDAVIAQVGEDWSAGRQQEYREKMNADKAASWHNHQANAFAIPFEAEMYKAGMVLKIAEEEGPDAALLWKLSN